MTPELKPTGQLSGIRHNDGPHKRNLIYLRRETAAWHVYWCRCCGAQHFGAHRCYRRYDGTIPTE